MTNRTRMSFAAKIRHIDQTIGLYKSNEIVAKEACARIRSILQLREIFEATRYDAQNHPKRAKRQSQP